MKLAPVQGDETHKAAGTVPWDVHERAWQAYAAAGHGSQSAARIAERAGFGYREMQCLLAGHYNVHTCRAKHPPVPDWAPLEGGSTRGY